VRFEGFAGLGTGVAGLGMGIRGSGPKRVGSHVGGTLHMVGGFFATEFQK